MTIDSCAVLSTGLEVSGSKWSGTAEVGDQLLLREGDTLVGEVEVGAVETGVRVRDGSRSLALHLRLWGVEEVAAGMRLTLKTRAGLALLPVTADGAAGLTFVGRQRLARFDDLSYRWVDCKRFRINSASDDRRLLRALLMHPQYRDPYYIDALTTEPIHGPYNLVRITQDSFIESSASAATGAFREWVGALGAISATQIDGDLDQIEQLIRDSESRYLLPDLGRRAQHMQGWILDVFFELILINRSQQHLDLLVASAD